MRRPACQSCNHAAAAPDNLAVWAMHRRGLTPVGNGSLGALPYTAPSYSNPNMHAQAGMATNSIETDGRSLDRMLRGELGGKCLHPLGITD